MWLWSEAGGTINDMWMDHGRCHFKIIVSEGTNQWGPQRDWNESAYHNGTSLVGETIIAEIIFLNKTSGERESTVSSHGWRVGDFVNGTVEHGMDEYGEWYFLTAYAKSDVNFAENTILGIKESTFYVAVICIVCVVLIMMSILIVIRKRERIEEQLTHERVKDKKKR
jgi:hypothetical protein